MWKMKIGETRFPRSITVWDGPRWVKSRVAAAQHLRRSSGNSGLAAKAVTAIFAWILSKSTLMADRRCDNISFCFSGSFSATAKQHSSWMRSSSLREGATTEKNLRNRMIVRYRTYCRRIGKVNSFLAVEGSKHVTRHQLREALQDDDPIARR